MADRVADEGEAAQDDEGAHDGADDADQDRRHQAALHEAVGQRVEDEVEHVSAASSWKCRSPRARRRGDGRRR